MLHLCDIIGYNKKTERGKQKMIKTALIKLNGNLKIIRDEYYSTNKEFENELRANGYKVLKVWNGNKSDKEIEKWEFYNRK